MEMPVNQFKRAIASGNTLIGAWLMSGTPSTAEALGSVGFDFLVVDMEHTPIDTPQMIGILQAIAGTPAQAIVRPPWNDMVMVKRAMDAGAQTLLFPFVQNADEAKRAVASTRYPPDGVRGVAGTHRGSRYGTIPNYLKRANEEVCVIVQIETVPAFDQLRSIAAVPGVDSIFIGPGDLSASMGFIGDIGNAAVQDKLKEGAQEQRVAAAQVGVGVAEAGVYLHRQPAFDPGPQQVAQQHGIGDTNAAALLDVAQPPARRLGDLGRRRRCRIEVEPEPVADDALHPARAGRLIPQRGPEAAGEAAGRRVPGHDGLLGHPFQPDDLGHAGARRLGHGLKAEHPVQDVTGVDEEAGCAAGAQQQPGRLVRAQVAASGEVLIRRCVWGQSQYRGTPAAHRDAELGVEPGRAGGHGAVRLGDQLLEHGAGQTGAQHPIGVVVYQGEGADGVGEQGGFSHRRPVPRRGRYRPPPGPARANSSGPPGTAARPRRARPA